MQNQIDGSLKNLFKNDIRGSFLIDIKYRGLNELVENFFTIYDFSYSEEQIITGVGAYHEYDICKHIVGIHKANTIFFTAEEKTEIQKDENYKTKLRRAYLFIETQILVGKA